jgi:hypothetical protein
VEERGEETAFPPHRASGSEWWEGESSRSITSGPGENIVGSDDSSEGRLRLKHFRIYFMQIPMLWNMGLMRITFCGYYNPCI